MAASLCCHCLFKIEYCSAVGVCVFPQEFLYHSGGFCQPFASVVSVDNGKDTPGFESHFGTFVVAGGSAYAACPVAVDGKPLNVQRSAPDAFEGLFRTSASKPPMEYPVRSDTRLMRSTSVSIWYSSSPRIRRRRNASAEGR